MRLFEVFEIVLRKGRLFFGSSGLGVERLLNRSKSALPFTHAKREHKAPYPTHHARHAPSASDTTTGLKATGRPAGSGSTALQTSPSCHCLYATVLVLRVACLLALGV